MRSRFSGIRNIGASMVALVVFLACVAAVAEEGVVPRWALGSPVLSPGPAGSFDEIAVKDPSVVFHGGAWHVFYTARSRTEYTTGYVSAAKWSDLQSAPRHQLAMMRGESRYGCAPQVFYFEPQRKWYLVFQNGDANYQPAFSTTTTISDPASWSAPKPLLAKDWQGKWIDFWVICDEARAHLFYTVNQSEVFMRSTTLEAFPGGWGAARKVYDGIHEAAHIYKVAGKGEYHMIYELNHDGIRSFGLARAARLDGPWTKVTNEYATATQLHFADGMEPWTEMVSHGEVLRSGCDQRMEYDPENCKWLIQGITRADLKEPYAMLRWRLGMMEKTEDRVVFNAAYPGPAYAVKPGDPEKSRTPSEPPNGTDR